MVRGTRSTCPRPWLLVSVSGAQTHRPRSDTAHHAAKTVAKALRFTSKNQRRTTRNNLFNGVQSVKIRIFRHLLNWKAAPAIWLPSHLIIILFKVRWLANVAASPTL